jgi:hypothetical protein
MNTKPQSLYRIVSKVASATRDFLLALMGLLCLALGIVVALGDRLPAAGVFFTAGLLLCMFSSLSRFESVKGLGIEAKMADLNNKLNEADQLLKHIRDSVGLMADVSFQSMALTGFWDRAFPKQQALVLADAFRQQLRELGENDEEINRRMAPWHESNIRDLVRPIYKEINDFVDIQRQKLSEEMRELKKPISDIDPEYVRLNGLLSKNAEFGQELHERWLNRVNDFGRAETLIESAPCGTPEEKRKLIKRVILSIEDVRHYVENKDFRDRHRWLASPYH